MKNACWVGWTLKLDFTFVAEKQWGWTSLRQTKIRIVIMQYTSLCKLMHLNDRQTNERRRDVGCIGTRERAFRRTKHKHRMSLSYERNWQYCNYLVTIIKMTRLFSINCPSTGLKHFQTSLPLPSTKLCIIYQQRITRLHVSSTTRSSSGHQNTWH